MAKHLTQDHITNADINDLILDYRPGRKRLHFFYLAKPEIIHQIFNDYIEGNKKLFKLPDDLTNQAKVNWPKVTEPDSMILDLRSDFEIKDATESGSRNTFKAEVDIWNEKPMINSFKKSKLSNWTASVHYIKATNQILYISPAVEDEELIDFMICKSTAPYDEVNHLQYP